MLIEIRELEAHPVDFDETIEPGAIDFGPDVRLIADLKSAGRALANLGFASFSLFQSEQRNCACPQNFGIGCRFVPNIGNDGGETLLGVGFIFLAFRFLKSIESLEKLRIVVRLV